MGLELHLYKTATDGYDISNLVESVKWKGRKGSAARSITITLIDDDGYKHARAGIDVEKGHQCIYYEDGSELFRGLIMDCKQSNKKKLSFTAYDNGIYLANNKDSFTYENKTADEIFVDVCKRFNLKYGKVDRCEYRIPELIKSNTTAFDTIMDALSQEYKSTGIRHYITSEKGVLNLITRRRNVLQWVLSTNNNISSYTYQHSISDVKTRVKLLSSENTVVAESRDSELESRIGIFQQIEKPDSTLNEAQLTELANSILKEKSASKKSLQIEAIGNSEIISGLGVYIIIPHLNISKTYYVDEDTHTISGKSHRVSLTLTEAEDINIEQQESLTYNIGDTIDFYGGYHYVSSYATEPTGTECAAGKAKITAIAPDAIHPYHIIHTDSQSRVYGWVDANKIGGI